MIKLRWSPNQLSSTWLGDETESNVAKRMETKPKLIVANSKSNGNGDEDQSDYFVAIPLSQQDVDKLNAHCCQPSVIKTYWVYMAV